MDYIDKIGFLHLKDGYILSTRSQGKDTYYIPGGKREAGETDLETLCREVQEELSVTIVPESAKCYGVFEAQAHGKAEGLLVKMTCYTGTFVGELKANSEIAELDWLSFQDIHRTSPVDQIIFQELHQKGLLR